MNKLTHIGDGEIRPVVHPENRSFNETRHQIAITAGWLAFDATYREQVKELLFDMSIDDTLALATLEGMYEQQRTDAA